VVGVLCSVISFSSVQAAAGHKWSVSYVRPGEGGAGAVVVAVAAGAREERKANHKTKKARAL